MIIRITIGKANKIEIFIINPDEKLDAKNIKCKLNNNVLKWYNILNLVNSTINSRDLETIDLEPIRDIVIAVLLDIVQLALSLLITHLNHHVVCRHQGDSLSYWDRIVLQVLRKLVFDTHLKGSFTTYN